MLLLLEFQFATVRKKVVANCLTLTTSTGNEILLQPHPVLVKHNTCMYSILRFLGR